MPRRRRLGHGAAARGGAPVRGVPAPAGGPAEQTFAALVGLELRPRRLREAAALWAALTEHRGTGGRDALWGHPDLLPDEEAFADPQAFAASSAELDDLGDLEGGSAAE